MHFEINRKIPDAPQKSSKSLLTGKRGALITPLNDGGDAADDEILRSGEWIGGFRKGVDDRFEKVLKVASFG